MSVWKQIILCLVVLLIAAGVWVRFFPGSADILARWGIEGVPFATARTAGEAGGEESRRGGGRGGGQGGSVITAEVSNETINDRLSAIGTGRAIQSVVVTPYTSGRLMEIAVQSGARVQAGDVIARLDSEAEEIAADRARFALADAEERLQRVQSLRTSNTVTDVQVKEAELAVENARLALRDAELALQRRAIVAPISGVVGILPVAAGNYVTAAQTEIATIDDRSSIVVDFWVPERYATMIEIGAPLSATAVARPNEVFEGAISAIDNRIDAESRTLQVQATLENPGDALRAGMSFQVSMRFPGDTYPAVDPLAVQWGADGAFVWAIANGRAERVPVRIVQRNTDNVLVDADLGEGDIVVTEGIHSVREGAEVRIASRSPASLAPQIDSGQPAAAASGS
jgi:RND family efflux transporter MFP subunit